MSNAVDKVAWGIFFLIVFLVVCLIGLIGWGFIEFVTWVTSK